MYMTPIFSLHFFRPWISQAQSIRITRKNKVSMIINYIPQVFSYIVKTIDLISTRRVVNKNKSKLLLSLSLLFRTIKERVIMLSVLKVVGLISSALILVNASPIRSGSPEATLEKKWNYDEKVAPKVMIISMVSSYILIEGYSIMLWS